MPDHDQFVRDHNRYIVVKRSRLTANEEEFLTETLEENGINTLECLVIEPGWPEYEPTWKAIEERVRKERAAAEQFRSVVRSGLSDAARYLSAKEFVTKAIGPSIADFSAEQVEAAILKAAEALPPFTKLVRLPPEPAKPPVGPEIKDLVYRFFNLRLGSQRRKCVEAMQVLTDNDWGIPEVQRYNVALERIGDRGKLREFAKLVATMENE